MPKATLTLPTGERITVRGDTEEELIEKVSRVTAPSAQKPNRQPIDVEANRKEAIKKFSETLSPIERFGIGVREPIATAGARIDRLMGNPNEEVERGLEYSREVGGVAAGIGRAVPAIAALSRVPAGVLPSAAAGGAYGAATGEDTVSGALSGAAGGAAGSVAAGLLGRSANAVAGRWATRAVQGSDDVARTLDDFQALGGRLTPGQASGGRAMRFVDEALANNPITATPYSAIEKTNQGVLNRTLAKAVGVTAKNGTDEIGPSALRAADDVISAHFNSVADSLDAVPLPSGMGDDITELLSERTVKPMIGRIRAGNITGRDYMDVRSKLLAITRRQGSDKVDDAWDLIDELDDVVEGIAPEGYKTSYAAAREQYKVLLAIDRYRNSVNAGGDANARTLAGALRSIFKKQYTRNLPSQLPETQDLFTAVRALSDPRLSPLTGGSPTAGRLLPYVLAGGPLITGDFATSAALAGGAVIGSRAALAAPASEAARRAGGVIGTAAAAETGRRVTRPENR